MLYQLLAITGGASSIGLLIVVLWQRAAVANAQKSVLEQAQLVTSLTAALDQAKKSETDQERRYADLVRYWQAQAKKLEAELDTCQDPAVVRARLRELLSVPQAPTDSGAGASGSVSS